ncbi:MAG TPA: UvrD-helicase domain-containing protein [Nitrospinota bacterium]|nr:UvrD-helicase domain-containing protein [Nitrospinota bacterium]
MKNKQIGSRYPVVDGNSLSAAQQQLLSNELENQLAASLNKHQLEAVLAPSGPLMILAGAGSGKTRVITYRIARLISEGVQPWAILALTFTNKAAQEMKERTQSLLRMHSTNLWISTFHSVCLRLLRKHHEFINYPRDFAVYDAQDQKRLIKTILKDLNLEEKKYPAREILSKISKFKNKMKNPVDAEEEKRFPWNHEFVLIFQRYEDNLREAKVMDFDDLLIKTVEMLQNNQNLCLEYRNKFQHILIDEFQDSNVVQYNLIRLLVNGDKNICVVGDDDQSIYQWRGANVGNILSFENDFPETKVVLLEQNYRSTSNIISAASAVISRNPDRKDKRLWTENEEGDKVTLKTALDETAEASFVVKTILSTVKSDGLRLSDVAVFYRTNSQSRAIEDGLRNGGLAYQIYGGLKFYERKEVKDILAYFRAALNPFDTVNLKRIINTPPRGIGAVTIEKLEHQAAADGVPMGVMLDNISSVHELSSTAKAKLEGFREVLSSIRTFAGSYESSEAISRAMEESGYMRWLLADNNSESLSRIENLNELVSAAAEFSERTGNISILSFLDQTALMADADMVDQNTGTVKLMTIHISKGLEFPMVFITGMEDNLFPHARSKDDPRQMQEERRLLYVAMTRAKEKLFLSHALSRRLLGISQTNMPSPFLADLPTETTECKEYSEGIKSSASIKQYSPCNEPLQKFVPDHGIGHQSEKLFANSMDGYEPGIKVAHPSFGVGVIRAIDGKGDKSKITVYFPRYGSKKLVKKFAKLKPVGIKR